MPRYKIRAPHTFVEPDGTLKSGGQEIELGEDVAKTHADKVDLVEDPAPAAVELAAADPAIQA